MNDEQLGFETRCLHVGQGPDPATGAAAPPIYQTSSYEFPDADTAAATIRLGG
jgi:O-acetylhomoserine sulfhydrolase (EC 2.5.1.49)